MNQFQSSMADIVQRVIEYTDAQPEYRHNFAAAMEAGNERALRTGVRQRVQIGWRRPSVTWVVRPVDKPRTKR